ncbi:hypothetical protein BDV95DRAFT_256881 [Massariosphaeria phaeospora]|uniref:Uncharacterized protein n=1 Tax=Massariosphaeria phaeospora TaxID=100035 RepID=A0A7C8M257_9PLEO|nr:hypothetical protein BDV95DRAFT_256881 [Massariosphaeria phaeospora]
MSSSCSTPTSSNSFSQYSSNSSQYRKVEYHDGMIIRIAESRRRSHVTLSRTLSTSSRRSQYTDTSIDYSRSTRSDPTGPYDQSHSSFSTTSPASLSYLTSVPHSSSRRRAKAVIIQASTSEEPKSKEAYPYFDASSMLTPPPTPRIERLSTPELPDLDETLFCDCCASHDLKSCASCGRELFRR